MAKCRPLNTRNNEGTAASAAQKCTNGPAGMFGNIPLFRSNRLQENGRASSSSSARKTSARKTQVLVTGLGWATPGWATPEDVKSFRSILKRWC